MKLKHLFLAGLAIGAFAACSNENEPQELNNGAPASLAIQVVNPVTKAPTVANGSASESAINDIYVAVFDAAGNFIADKDATADELTDKTIYFDNSRGLRAGQTYQVMVIANVKGKTGITLPTASKTFADYQKLVSNLANATVDNKFIMSGMKTTEAALVAAPEGSAENPENTISVEVSRIVAKVELNKISVNFSDKALEAGAQSFTLTDAYLVNGRSQSKIYNGASTASVYDATAGFLQGKAHNQILFADHVANAPVEPSYIKTHTTGNTVSNKASWTNDIFKAYVLANESDVNPTYLILNGYITFKNGSAPKNLFYKVLIEDDGNAGLAKKVLRNSVYQIEANITGISGGADPADLQVKVTVANWSIVPIHADLN